MVFGKSQRQVESQSVEGVGTDASDKGLQNTDEMDGSRKPSLSQEETKAESASPAAPSDERPDDGHGPKGMKFALLFGCILVANFFIGYDTSCVATLTPTITDQFHALHDLGWYTVAYLLTQSATMLIYGQLYSFYSMKTLFMQSLCVFVVGSVLSAAAPTSAAFIIGRAISGFGAAGAFAGTTIIVAHTTSLKHRPIYQAITGGVETIALAFGPSISGTISHYSSWRIAFYVIIPFIVVTLITVAISIGHLRRPENAHLTTKDGLKRIDWPGFAISVPMTLCLVIGLQWGGTMYPWANWRIILLLVLAGLLIGLFLIMEFKGGEESMVPMKMLGQRSVAFSSIITFCNYAHLSVIAYYLPFYFQAVRGSSTIGSGLMYLPTAIALAIGALAGGPLTSLVGYYNIPLMLGSILMTIGSALITTFAPDSSPAKWIGYQIIYGLGIGLAFQPPYIAVQTVLPETVVPRGLVMLSYMQQSGGIIILSIAQNVFLSRLARNIATEVPGLDPATVLNSGALGIIDNVPAQFRDQVIIAYNEALVQVFYIALGLTCLATVSMLGIEWKSVKKEEKK